jgi:signal transduction histidine kinase
LTTVYPFIPLAVVSFVTVAAILARRGRYFFAARIIVFAGSASAFSEVLIAGNLEQIHFATMPIVVASILLSPYDTLAIYGITIAGYLILPSVMPGIRLTEVTNPIIVATVIGVVSLAASIVHKRDLKQIMVQTAELVESQDRILDAKKMEAIARLSSGLASQFDIIVKAIRANSQVIERTSSGGARERARRIALSTVRAAHLTERLLAVSEQQLLQPTVVDIDEVMQGHKQRLKSSVRDNITLHLIPSAERKILNIDVKLFCEAIRLLVMKAQENIPGHGTIAIQTKIADLSQGDEQDLPAGAYCAIVISNSGVTKMGRVETRVFEPFFTSGEFGTGDMDLAAAYGTIRQSGGLVETKIDPDLGTTFVVTIPRQVAPA